MLISFTAILISGILSDFRFVLNIFDISNVYKLRFAFREENTHWILLAYITFAAKIIPILVVISIELKKKYIYIVLLAISQIFLFSIGANRLFLFDLLLIIMVYYFGKKNHKILVYLLLAVYLLIYVENYINITQYGLELIRRISITPNLISQFYFDFFKVNPPDFLKQHLDWLTHYFNLYESNYTTPIPRIIGSIYSSNIGENMNTGLVGGGFANYGMYSLILSPLGFILSFRLLDSILYKLKENNIKLAISVVITTYLINSNQFFSLLFKPSEVLMLFLSLMFLQMEFNGSNDEIINEKKINF